LELTISLPHGDERVALAGPDERNLKIIRESFGVRIAARNGSLWVRGDEKAVRQAADVLDHLIEAAKQHQPMDRQELRDKIASAGHTQTPAIPTNLSDQHEPPQPGEGIQVYLGDKIIKAKTKGQQAYLDAIMAHDLTLCTGPAGTGKTYLAVAAAVGMLKRGQVRKLVLVRPAVEAGEKLGFLPGSMHDKVNPYLRPLLDALHDMMDFEETQRFMACDLIEIVPLGFMRGRTLNRAMIILDEAQNTTRSQMLMFLTRLGIGSKMIVTGDTSQIDLEDPTESGLVDAAKRLRRIEAVAMVTLDHTDIARHNLVQKIVQAYGQNPVEDHAKRSS